MREKDEDIIAHITSITFQDEPLKKTYTFNFGENAFFSNSTLQKVIYLEDEETALYSEGTEINWKGEDFTKKTIKKKQKNKKTGQTRVIEKVVPGESFFNFFNSVDLRDEAMDDKDDEEA